MQREDLISMLIAGGTKEVLSGKIIETDEDLGGEICGFLFGSENDFCTNVFHDGEGQPIVMEFQPDGIFITVPGLDVSFYTPRTLPYADISDSSLAALCKIAGKPQIGKLVADLIASGPDAPLAMKQRLSEETVVQVEGWLDLVHSLSLEQEMHGISLGSWLARAHPEIFYMRPASQKDSISIFAPLAQASDDNFNRLFTHLFMPGLVGDAYFKSIPLLGSIAWCVHCTFPSRSPLRNQYLAMLCRVHVEASCHLVRHPEVLDKFKRKDLSIEDLRLGASKSLRYGGNQIAGAL